MYRRNLSCITDGYPHYKGSCQEECAEGGLRGCYRIVFFGRLRTVMRKPIQPASAVYDIAEAQRIVKTLLIIPVAALYLAIVMWRSRTHVANNASDVV